MLAKKQQKQAIEISSGIAAIESHYKVTARIPFKMASIEKHQAFCTLENPNPHELILIVENIKKQAKKKTAIATGVK